MKNISRTTKQSPKSTGENIGSLWQQVVRRRSFLKGIGMAGVTLSAGGLLVTEGKAQVIAQTIRSKKLSKGDVALLKFAAWAEIVETDLWIQYAELGGVGPSDSNEQFQGFFGGNLAYTLALQNLDGDMPQYITDNTDDEISHGEFLNAYLISKG